MAERISEKSQINGNQDVLAIELPDHKNLLFNLRETVFYPNGGQSRFYTGEDTVFIVDKGVDIPGKNGAIYPYSLITDKQNYYAYHYKHLYRFLEEDLSTAGEVIADNPKDNAPVRDKPVIDRANLAEVSPLEYDFEENFSEVYGADSVQYLNKEYMIEDSENNHYYLDYLVHTTSGDIAVEENGIRYHHPQIAGLERYRNQLRKQNTCTQWNIKLYRFSTDDCRYHDRIRDDIRSFFGKNVNNFISNGVTASRPFKLYDHQEKALFNLQQQRRLGRAAALLVYPTASGKSRIVEEDMNRIAKEQQNFRALILAPNHNIIVDWEQRVRDDLQNLQDRIEIRSFQYIIRHYQEYPRDRYSYIVCDEAHHAVAPVLKRVIQYFTPDMLVGLTATDKRLDNKKLEDVFGSYKTDLSLEEAMNKHIIAKANVFRIETNIDLSHIRFNGKDYVNADLETSVRVTSRNELIVQVLLKYFCAGKIAERQGIVFCVNKAHAHEMAKLLNNAGIVASAYTSDERNELDHIMQDFKDHKIRFLCSCNMINEGWDYPEIGILVMARPTLSRVLYLQQIGRGLRRTDTKKNVIVIDVVDEYGPMAKAVNMHTIFQNPYYVPFGLITNRQYHVGDMVEIDGLHEEVRKIIPVDTESFESKYGNYLNQEQIAREYFVSTGTVTSWIHKKKIVPDADFKFGTSKIYLFSPDSVQEIREKMNIPIHNDETIYQDFMDFLEERNYSLSYKMVFLLSFIRHMNSIGDAKIEDILNDYIAFYQDRLDQGLAVDRATCPYDAAMLKDRKAMQRNMLTNPFEKFERKRFMYYSKDLSMISMNHALFEKLQDEDYEKIRNQMKADLENYYKDYDGLSEGFTLIFPECK